MRYMTKEEQKIFWAKHKASRDAIDEYYKNLPQADKNRIDEKMRVNHKLMRNAILLVEEE